MLVIPNIRQLSSENLSEAGKCLAQLEAHPIGCVNWPESFPYCPRAEFHMAHNGKELFLQFTVEEACTMALVDHDNGEVWTDSCVEFFLALDDTGYYNFEFSCIGKALLGFRKERPNAVHAQPEIMSSIKRMPTLGTTPFKERQLQEAWSLTVAIPVSALFRHRVENWQDIAPRINVYKCGDNLSQPHYVSWMPIDTPKPDFHVARCFTAVQVEAL